MSKKVLIVDDEAIIRNRMSDIARREGYHPLTASNGVEALDILKAQSVDLLLTDVQMPQMSGINLITIMTGKCAHEIENVSKYFGGNLQEYAAFVEACESIHILMMSKDPGTIGQIATSIGASGCFPKSYDKRRPFNEGQFVETLRQYLSE
jgi:CheY-like chemotaxis protein